VTHKDRPKLPLFVLAAGAILLGAAALQSVLVVGPGPGSSPHAIGVETSRPATTPATTSTPSPWNPPAPRVEVAPAEPSDQFPTAAVPDAPHSADHPIDLAHPASPPEPESGSAEPPADAAKAEPQPATATPPAKVEGAGTETPREPDKTAPGARKVETPPAEAKPPPQPEPSQDGKASEETPPPVQVPPGPETKPIMAVEPKVEAPSELKPEPEPAAKSDVVDVKPEPVPALTPKSEVKQAAPEVKPLKPEPAPKTKIIATEAKPEPAGPKSAPVEKPKAIATAKAQTKPVTKPMSLGFGRIAKPLALSSKVGSGRYAASVRASIGRHRPAARGGGSATVAFRIGPAGGLQGLKVVRSSGKPQLDQAAIVTVRSAAPFPPPPAGANPNFSIQIYFR
jgi:protein TonB